MKKVAVAAENLSMSNPCWSCNALTDDVFCKACSVLQPLNKMNAFARLHLSPLFDIDLKVLEQNYFKNQRLVHPDRFVNAQKMEKIYSAQHSSAINDAYESLKNPISRTEELLKISGHPLPNIEQQSLNDPELLMEVIELREELVDAQTMPLLASLKSKLDFLIQENVTALSTAFETENYDQVTKLLNRLRYMSKLLREANQRRVA